MEQQKISESIFSGKKTVIPMSDVQHVEKHWYQGDKKTKDNWRGLLVITKHTRWDMDADTWANHIYLDREEGQSFLRAWCEYRAELEGLKPA